LIKDKQEGKAHWRKLPLRLCNIVCIKITIRDSRWRDVCERDE